QSVGRDVTARKQAEIERQALLEIAQGFANTKDLQELLKLIHRSVAKVIYAENFFVVRYQPNRGLFEEIYSVDQYDLPEPPAKLEKSITSYVFRSGEPLLLTQVLFDELVKQGELKLIGTNSASWLGVPLKTSDRTIGVMAVQDYENDNRYTERDRDFLTSIATQVALAIEHREAGIALRESEEHYRAIFEGVQDAIFVESTDGKILTVNERACEMFGYSHSEFLAKTVTDLVPKGYPILTVDGLTATVSPEPRETVNQRANGEIFPIEISGRVQVINGESVLLAVVSDITKRKRAEERLRESEERFSSAFEYASIGVALLTPAGHWLRVNRALCDLSGYSEAELLEKNFQDLTHPDDLESDLDYVRQLLAGQINSYQMEKRYFHKLGHVLWVLLSVSLVRGDQGEPLYFISQIQDITERKQAEAALLESINQFRTLFEASPDAIMLLDPSGNWPILDCNTAACEMNGYARDELIGQSVDILNAIPGVASERTAYLERIRQANILRYETLHRHKNGTMFPIEVSTSVISLNGRDVILGIDRDITERKQAENSLKAEREKAQKYLDIAGVMMLALDPNGTVTLINQKGCEILGYPVDEIIGKDWIRTFLPEAERGELQKVFQQLTRDKMESVGYYENNILTKNGEKRLIAWHNTVVRDAQGTIINTLSSGEDITARKQAEAELRASEERFRQLADNIQEVFWMTDAESGKELYISPAAEAIWGRSVESLMSDPSSFANSIFPEDQPAVVHAIERERSGERVEIEYRIVQPNGSLRWVWDRGFPIFDESGRAKRIAGISADITERREAELALVQSQSRYRELFDSSPISIWEEDFSAVKKRLDSLQKIGLADLKEYLFNHPEEIVELASLVRITDVNNAALELYGVEQKEVLLKGLTQILSKDTLKHFQDEILGFMSPSKKFIWEGTDHSRDGKPMEVVVTGSIPYGYEEDWSKVIVSVSDITERKRAEAEIRRRAKETSALLETSLALTNLDLKATLQTVSNSARALFAADGCRIFLMEPDGESLRCVLALQENPTAFSNLRIRIGEGVTGAVAASGQAEIVNQMQNDPRGVQVPGTQEQEEEAIMFAPLKERDHTIGVLSIRRAGAERPFQAADLELLEAFASMAASAVSNARLFGETQRRLAELEALYENGLAVGRLLKRSEIGERVIKTFARHLAWHHVTIRLRREESDELELVAFNLPHLQNEEQPLTEQRFTAHISKVGQGLSGWVIQTGLPFRTGNVHSHPRYIVTHAEIQSGLYMPLKVGERVLGVIGVESELPDAFTEQDERLLATLAGQAAIAFENARLYEAIEQELSDRKRAEEALHASETHYRELADSITDILFELDQNLRYTHWNKASEALTGIPTEAAIGKSMYENEIFGDAEGQTSIRQIYEDVFKNRRPRTFERTMLLNRERRSFEINAYPSTRGVSVVAKDVTDRKKSEIIMQKRFELMEYSAHHTLSELMQRAVDEISELTGSAIGFLHFVEPDEVTLGMQTWSTNALRLFDVPDIPVSVTAHLPLDEAGVWAEAARQRHSLIQNNYESLSKKKGLPQGHVPILREMIVPIIRNERIVAVMGIGNKPQDYTQNDLELAERLADYAWDITERKQMQVALEAERNQLARRVDERTADLSRANSNLARALRVKDEFLANMSHELRTPLNAILGLSESLSEQTAGPLNEKQQKYIATISESGHHLLALINDILDLAKIDAGQITLDINKVDIHSVCQASLRMIKQLAQKKNQEVTLQIDDGLGLMWADERRLKQMIVNLLGNAVKFTPENGKLGLEVHGDQEANKVTITVWDNGIGIREGDLARLFQPFVQLDSGLARETTGTGLGLALVAQMARLHGGSVQVSSESEKGSRFSIVLPWEPALAMDSSSRLRITGKFRAIRPNETNQPTILLVEDTKEIVMMLKDYLELAGYKVVTAQDGVDAIVQAKLVRPDLILMDIQMPRMDGLETTRKLRSDPDFKFTPIIALTALAMPNDRERCLAAGMDEYISKPVNLKALVKIIQSCLFNEESKSR
ncbi:MAG TPA: PAS domain S-box protein, partial [Anaerolineales bacterium]|nr:PAS domain S-box protein [Anaerolineales bacterium]